jgi:acetolactate synthase small subunit
MSGEASGKHLVSLYVTNKPGVLNRVAQVFARRGFNVDSLVVSEAFDPEFSHMNIAEQARGRRARGGQYGQGRDTS